MPGLIKLNTNECPFPPSPMVHQALNADAVNDLRLYPDPNSSALKQALAEHFGVSTEHLFVGNGSDEVLAHAFVSFFQQSRPLLFPDITYGFYPVYCGLFDIEAKTIAVQDDFSLRLADFVQPNGGIIFPNPNAPTSVETSLDDIRELLRNNRESVVVVDEAYVDFGAQSAVPLVAEFDNILVVQTFSKSRALAGSRLGFAVGQPPLIEALERVKNSFNSYPVNRLTEMAGVAALADHEYFESCCEQVKQTRQWTTEQLQQLGFDVLPSKANFIMVKPSHRSAAEVFAYLREHNIIVRYFQKPRIECYLRISIGTDAEMQKLVDVLRREQA